MNVRDAAELAAVMLALARRVGACVLVQGENVVLVQTGDKTEIRHVRCANTGERSDQ